MKEVFKYMSRIFGDMQLNTESMLSYAYNDSTPVTEAYIGKTKELLAIERLFDTLIVKFKKDQGIQLNDCKEMRAINELFKKQFGFNEFTIVWMPDMTVNGFTYGQSVITKNLHGKSFKLDKSRGYYDVDHAMSVLVCMHTGMLTTPEVSGDALTGVVLHEIGHNFDNSIYLYAQELMSIRENIFGALFANLMKIGFGKYGKDMAQTLGYLESMDKNSTFLVRQALKIYTLAQSIEKKIKNTKTLFKLLQGTCRIVSKVTPLSVIDAILGVDGEFHSDEVAAMYGYGAGNAKFLMGIRNYDYGEGDYRHYVPTTLMPIVDLSELALTSFIFTANPLSLINAHPSDRTRARNMIKKLERDLANADYPPKMKETLQKDLEEQKKIYKEYIDVKTLEKGRPFRYTLNKFYEALGGGSVYNLVPRKHI